MSGNELNHHIERLKESFLCAAARGGRIEECASLLDLGALTEWPFPNEPGVSEYRTDDETHQYHQDTPLIEAVRNGHKDVAALLLAHGASPTRKDEKGNTVMHLAAAFGDEGMASLFSPNASALSFCSNDDGLTAIDVAVERGFASFAEHLFNLCGSSDGVTSPSEEKLDRLTSTHFNSLSIDGAMSSTSQADENDDNSIAASSLNVQESTVDDQDEDSTTSGDSEDMSSNTRILHDATTNSTGRNPRASNSTDEESDHSAESTDSMHGADALYGSASNGMDHTFADSDHGSTHSESAQSNENSFRGQQVLEINENDTQSFNQMMDTLDDDDTVNQENGSQRRNNIRSETLMHQLRYMTELARSQAIELHQAKYALSELVQERNALKSELVDIKSLFCGEGNGLSDKSLAQLNSLEEQLKGALDLVVKVKEVASKNLEEERTCVICQERPKSVLLMSCRHLCVCKECGYREELERCPLCREWIEERIDVFS